MSQRNEIIAKIKDVPTLPTVAVQVFQLIRNPEFQIRELQTLIEHDPSLSANILKTANSAFFAGTKSINTIREAIVRLGSKRIGELVLTESVAPTARKEVKGYVLGPGELWEHMVMTAIATRHLADTLNVKLADYAFTAALLHDIGKIVLGNEIAVDPHPILDLAFDKKLSFERAEQEFLGIDHAEVGALLLEHWKLPPELTSVVRWHHEPEKCQNDCVILHMVHLANSITMMSGMGRGVDGLNYKPSENICKMYKLKVKTMEKVLNLTVISKDELKALFGGRAEG